MPTTKVHVKQVAQMAGTSIASVSRYYNHPSKVAPQTKAKIQEAIENLGYIRNRLASNLHHHKSDNIGIILPTIDNAIFSEMAESFMWQLQKNHRSTLIAATHYDMLQERNYVQAFLERKVDGLVLIGHQHHADTLSMIAHHQVPTIFCWNYNEQQHEQQYDTHQPPHIVNANTLTANIPTVGVDNVLLGEKIANYVFEQGHKNVKLLFPSRINNDRARDRLQGVLQAAKKHHIPINAHDIIECPYNIAEAKKAALSMFAHYQANPDNFSAIICGNDVIAQGVIYAANYCKIAVPDAVSICGIGDFKGSSEMEPALTTIRIPARRIGQATADLIERLIDNADHEYTTNVLLQPEIKIRNSVKQI